METMNGGQNYGAGDAQCTPITPSLLSCTDRLHLLADQLAGNLNDIGDCLGRLGHNIPMDLPKDENEDVVKINHQTELEGLCAKYDKLQVTSHHLARWINTLI